MWLRAFQYEDLKNKDQLYLVKACGYVFTTMHRVNGFSHGHKHFLIDECEEIYTIVSGDLDHSQGKAYQELGTKVSDDKLTTLIHGVCEYFQADPTQPSIVLSHLKSGEYYVAIHRFTERYAGGREIIVKVKNRDLDAAILEASKDFMTVIGRGPAMAALIQQAGRL